MPKVKVNDIHLYYEMHGPKEAEVLVLSNGILMSTASWVFQTRELSRHYRLLLYDCRGMWQSDHPPGPYSMEQHADDLAGLLDTLGIEKAHIGGISYGGEISMTFALRYPARTLSLIVADSVSHVDPWLRTVVEGWIATARTKDPKAFFSATAPWNFSPRFIHEHPDIMTQALDRYALLDYEAFICLCESFLHLNITERLGEIVAPTCVIVGEHDILKGRRYAEEIARRIPGAELHIIPGAGHATCWENPEAFNSIILGFLARHRKSGSDLKKL
ncbi:MAG: alpha/beta fold hydrolase [Anaerolineae bacterium]|nr:alpha/beta hydrolase [Anaerolineae bacterium]MDW8101913.1 alpha/beta fold hydrolase [Anaerolineae bacterium]